MRILVRGGFRRLISGVTIAIGVGLVLCPLADGQESKEATLLNELLIGNDYAARDRATVKTLRTSFSADYDQIEFSTIEKEIEQRYHINIMLDQSASDDLLESDSRISFELKDVSLQHGLRLMLAQHNATFFVDNGVVRIISLDDSLERKYLATRVYYVKPLLEKIVKSSPSGATDIQSAETKLIKMMNERIEFEFSETSSISLISGLLIVTSSQEFLESTELLISKLEFHPGKKARK